VEFRLRKYINSSYDNGEDSLTLIVMFDGKEERCTIRFMKIIKDVEYLVMCNVRLGDKMVEDAGAYERSDSSGHEVDYLSMVIRRWMRRQDYLYVRGDRLGSDSTLGKSV